MPGSRGIPLFCATDNHLRRSGHAAFVPETANGQASRTRHKAPEQSRPAAMAHGKEKSPRLFSSLKKTQNQNRYAAASCLLDLSSHQYSTAVTPAPKTIPQPNSRAMPLRVGTQMSARYSRKAPP